MLGVALWAQTPAPVKPPAAAAAPAASDPVVLSVGSESMTKSQFERLLGSLPAQSRAQAATPEGRRAVAERFVELQVLYQEAKRQGLERRPEVATQLKLQAESLLASAMYQQLVQSAKTPEEQLKADYERRKSEFEQAKVSHILVRFQGSQVPIRKDQKDLTEAEALAKATALKARIVKGEDFAAVAKAESDDTRSGEAGGDIGEISRGRTIPEFEQAAFTQPIGQLSDPVKTAFGYHLIKVESRGVTPFDKVRPDLEREHQSDGAAVSLKTLRDKAGVKLDETYFAPAPAAPGAAEGKLAPGTPKPAAPKPAAPKPAAPAAK